MCACVWVCVSAFISLNKPKKKGQIQLILLQEEEQMESEGKKSLRFFEEKNHISYSVPFSAIIKSRFARHALNCLRMCEPVEFTLWMPVISGMANMQYPDNP